MAIKEFILISSAVMPTLPMATPMHNTFFNWNLTLLRISVTLVSKLSECVTNVGNLPALFRPGPRRRGIWGMRTCDARNPSKDWANFFTNFLFLFSFFQILDTFEWNVHFLCLLTMHSISQHTNLHAWPRNIWKLDRSCETLITRCVIILQTNL